MCRRTRVALVIASGRVWIATLDEGLLSVALP